MAKIKTENIFLITIFVISTCGLIYELISGAIASYLLGDSVLQFSLVIGIYLFAMGIGSFFSKFIKKNYVYKFIEIELAIGLIGGLSAPILFATYNFIDFFEVILYLFVFIIGCLVGLEIPLLMIILKDKFEFNDLVSNVFTYDYIGALLASLLFPLVFIPYLGLISTSLVFGIVNILIGIIMIYMLKPLISNTRILKIKSFFALFILIVTLIFSKKILQFSEERLYGENIIFSKNSKYQRIVLTHEREDYRLYLNNNLQFSTFDEYRYHEMLVHPAMSFSDDISNVLILGGGDGMAAREILKYDKVKKITLVDLDSEITKMFKENNILKKFNQNSLNNSKIKIINQDAFIWLKQNKTKFNVVIIDFPDPSNFSIGKLYSKQFYKILSKSLAENYILSIQSTSPFFAPKSYWCIQNTLKDNFQNVLPYHVYLPSFGEWGYSLVTNNNLVVKRKLTNLKFFDYKFVNFTYFPKDMKSTTKEINSIHNQELVNLFNKEWNSL